MPKSPLKGLLVSLWIVVLSSQNLPAQENASPWTVVPGSAVRFRLTETGGAPGYVLDLGDGHVVAEAAMHDLALREGSFDPTSRPLETVGANDGVDLFVVQFHTKSIAEWRRLVTEAGAEIIHYLPYASHVIRVDGQGAERLRRLPFVRWVGDYRPEWRIDTELAASTSTEGVVDCNVLMARTGWEDKRSLADWTKSAGGHVVFANDENDRLMTISLPTSKLAELTSRVEVLFTDRWTPLEPDMDVVRAFGGANYIFNTAGFDGTGVRGEVFDGNIETNHADFQNHPVIIHGTPGGDAFHGTACFGIVFGDGTANPMGRGLLPQGQGIFGTAPLGSSRLTVTLQLVQPPFEAVFQSSSVGSAQTPSYTTISADLDNTSFAADFVMCQSMSNLGTQSCRPQAWAKNVVGVGGVFHQNSLTRNDDSWSGGASIGPAADGRNKPDLCFFYDQIFTTSNTTTTAYTAGFNGTSSATPITAGHFGLFFQMWSMGLFGNSVMPGGTVFQNRPHAATARAMMINTATPYPFSGVSHDLTRTHQGWGTPNLQRLYDERTRIFVVDESDVLTEFQTRRYEFQVSGADADFAVTLNWSDPAANPASAIHRINDLTLRVVDPNGNTYWGNSGLGVGNVSTLGGGPDSINTTENVFVLSPTPGLWAVEVRVMDVNADSHVETPAVDVDYALVVRGGVRVTPMAMPIGQANLTTGSFNVLGAVNGLEQPPSIGVPGPFSAEVDRGQPMLCLFDGPANHAFMLLSGPLNPQNRVFAALGSLDLGLNGAAFDFSDVSVVLNPFAPANFLSSLAILGPNGSQSMSFTMPTFMPSGPVANLQCLFINPLNTSMASFSAAMEVRIP